MLVPKAWSCWSNRWVHTQSPNPQSFKTTFFWQNVQHQKEWKAWNFSKTENRVCIFRKPFGGFQEHKSDFLKLMKLWFCLSWTFQHLPHFMWRHNTMNDRLEITLVLMAPKDIQINFFWKKLHGMPGGRHHGISRIFVQPWGFEGHTIVQFVDFFCHQWNFFDAVLI